MPLCIYVSFTPFVYKVRQGLQCQWFQHLQKVLQNGRYFGEIGQLYGGTGAGSQFFQFLAEVADGRTARTCRDGEREAHRNCQRVICGNYAFCSAANCGLSLSHGAGIKNLFLHIENRLKEINTAEKKKYTNVKIAVNVLTLQSVKKLQITE